MNETTSMSSVFGPRNGGTHRPESFAGTGIGPIERRAYGQAWRDALRFRWNLAVGDDRPPIARSGGFASLTRLADVDGDTGFEENASREGCPPSPARIAAALLLARAFDAAPDAARDLICGGAPVVVDIADGAMLDALKGGWRGMFFDDALRMIDLVKTAPGRRDGLDGAYIVLREPLKGAAKQRLERVAADMCAYALPFVAFSSNGRACLPKVLNEAARYRIELPMLDPATVSRTIRAVTGIRTAVDVPAETMRDVGVGDLAAAIRFDRTPEECVDELHRLAASKRAERPSRGLALSEIHGMAGARAWADDAIADLAAWRHGEIPWDAVSSAVMLAGPPGVGKTLFAEAFARSASGEDSKSGIPLIVCSYYSWQAEGHLGDFLAAMRRDFASARAQAPCVMLLEECDSFVDRRAVKHSHSDYVRNCINALLEEVDGVRRREGVFLIGCTNEVEACDPALLRAGRFENVVRISPPDQDELKKIFRVRLKGDLVGVDISTVVMSAAGMTGADAERAVKDARRVARRENRELRLDDLRLALVGDHDVSGKLRWRTSIHEAGHAVVDVLRFGPDGVVANTTRTDRRLGMSMRTTRQVFEGTASDYRSRIEVLLAGRAAEEVLLGEASHGAQQDLAEATRLSCAMLGGLGLAGPSPLTHLGDPRHAEEFLRHVDIRAAVGIELAEADRACHDLLEGNRTALIAVARRLFERGSVDGAEIAALLEAERSAAADAEGARGEDDAPFSGEQGGTVIAFPELSRD
ncbi:MULTISPECIES: AAA family ATPase [Bradyrhizobium]|uniref:Cell division protease FtsH n=2 Tax=Bradyrhizobium elkanii TaxID=29448 RepID=A0ABV4FBQ5_BRAEL|nr:AAA family ATPase [Bradyrhizobium elkanii]MBP2432423.1 DNA polymerase III delta prime subunit [Bradyrhizobium elkanii]MCP1734258.1 DNA polymerase III delta prime subunit [Bradyrhizobium elkanii]MCP1751940.1 DNA polymerase III delta prime subunit [Bradyrhizobium elkanii]MCP1977711.1 DNA polymerase III delta prime subunit [Bradyrhizobium elkanii]MCS3569595.1 DNA polymerase III delta prime subunit [Bradyrhizobium elkanii]